VRKNQDYSEAASAHDQRQNNLRQRPHAKGGEELRTRTVADGENEKAEEDGFEQGRDDEGPELAKKQRHDQGAGG
jgi:hypothetical protein